jgi:hypothetical protein
MATSIKMKNFLLPICLMLGCSSEPEGPTMTMHEYCRARVDEMVSSQLPHVSTLERLKPHKAVIRAKLFMMCIENQGM